MDERDIIIGLKDGNTAAYKQLFLLYYPGLFRFLLHLTHDKGETEDLLQDIFMKIWLNRSKIDPEHSIKSLLFVMAKNAAFNYLKKNKRIASNTDSENFLDSRNIESNIEFSELKSALDQRLMKMPDQRKRIFIMNKYQQLSKKEIADALSISVRTVEKHLELAMKDIKDIQPS